MPTTANPIYHIVFSYNGRENGWTETFYRQAASARKAVDMIGREPDWVKYRSIDTELFAIRASNVDSPRDAYSEVLHITQRSTGANPYSLTNNRDQITSCALLQVEGQAQEGPPTLAGLSKNWYLGGLSDDLMKYDSQGAPILTGNLKTVTDFMFGLMGQCGLLLRGALSPVQNPWRPVSSLQLVPLLPHLTAVNGDGLPGTLASGDRIVFKGVPRPPLYALQGSYPVVVLPGPPVQVCIRYNMLVPTLYPAAMYWRPALYRMQEPYDYDLVDIRSHKRGNSTERYRGRRRAARSAH